MWLGAAHQPTRAAGVQHETKIIAGPACMCWLSRIGFVSASILNKIAKRHELRVGHDLFKIPTKLDTQCHGELYSLEVVGPAPFQNFRPSRVWAK
jgi:hypothetical protein